MIDPIHVTMFAAGVVVAVIAGLIERTVHPLMHHLWLSKRWPHIWHPKGGRQ